MPYKGQHLSFPDNINPPKMKLFELHPSLEEMLGLEELVKWHQEEANRQVLKTGYYRELKKIMQQANSF